MEIYFRKSFEETFSDFWRNSLKITEENEQLQEI